MGKRETSKDVELAGRRWRIRKFDALTGSYIATKLIGKLGAVLAGIASGRVDNETAIAMAISESLGSMSKVEFMDMQSDALSVVGEITAVGEAEVVLPLKLANGAWGVKDIEDDLITVMALTVHSLVFNVSPFFDENALKSAISTFKDLNLFNAST